MSESTDTPTPRTDAALVESILCTEGGDEECTVYPAVEHVEADFARTLERELAERDESVKAFARQGADAIALLQQARAQLTAATARAESGEKERDELDRRHQLLTMERAAFSVDPKRVTQTELAMARTANSRLSDAFEQLTTLSAERDSLAKELEDAKYIADRLRPMAHRNDLIENEIDQIGLIVGCNHAEGLSRCVRDHVDTLQQERASLLETNQRLQQQIDEGLRFSSVCKELREGNDRLRKALEATKAELRLMVPVIGFQNFNVNGNANGRRRACIDDAVAALSSGQPQQPGTAKP